MIEYYPQIRDLVIWSEGIAAFIGILYFNQVKSTYWRWFVFYLIFIFLQELYWLNFIRLGPLNSANYYAYIGIPVQYLFFFWLYLYNSLNMKKLFYLLSEFYLLSYFPIIIFQYKFNVLYNINLIFGTIILAVCIILEFIKQISNEQILQFYSNKMFFVSTGITLFYIGTYPFSTFYDFLQQQNIQIWNAYYLYFLISNIIMYLLFGASFIWGKVRLES